MRKRIDIRQHCPEVEKLMGGKMPFVTRYGITIVAIVIFSVAVILFLSEGTFQMLIRKIIKYTIEQMEGKYKI